MTIATEMLASALETITALGTTCTVVEVAGTYDTDGTVSESLTTHAGVLCSDIVDESSRYRQQGIDLRCTGTIYLPASGLGFTPSVGNRVTYQSRWFQVVALHGYRVQGAAVAWRLDLAEVGA